MTRAAARFVLAKTVPMTQPLKSRALRGSSPTRSAGHRSLPGTSGRREISGVRASRSSIPSSFKRPSLRASAVNAALLGEAKQWTRRRRRRAIGEEPIESDAAQRALA